MPALLNKPCLLLLFVCSLSLLPSKAETDRSAGKASKIGFVDLMELSRQAQRETGQKPTVVHAPRRDPRAIEDESTILERQGDISGQSTRQAVVTQSPPPDLDFEGAPDNGFFIPPDTMGAVGPDHLIVILNGTFQVQDRTGRVITRTSLDQFWSSVGPFFETFDPKVFYDAFENRWIAVTCADPESPTSSVFVGVSTTSDPDSGVESFPSGR
jgi:hypothetical protein